MKVVDEPPIKSEIFHSMYKELYELGQLRHGFNVLCPMCLMPKTCDDLTLEHIIPKRALRHDPNSLRKNHNTNDRAGLTLTCQSCNGLKGRFYDPIIEMHFKYPKPTIPARKHHLALKAERTLGYLAAFRERGYKYILSTELDGVRLDFLDPQARPIITGVNFVSQCFVRDFPHAYFDGWCDTFEETELNGKVTRGQKIHSLTEIYRDPFVDTIQVRIRHITVMLPAGGTRNLIVPKNPGEGMRWHVNVSAF